MTKTQKRILYVLARLTKLVEENKVNDSAVAEAMEAMLGDLAADDQFGTEGQNDPRGDFREGCWSMGKIQV